MDLTVKETDNFVINTNTAIFNVPYLRQAQSKHHGEEMEQYNVQY